MSSNLKCNVKYGRDMNNDGDDEE